MRQMKMWKEEIQFFDCLDSTNLEASRQAIAQAPEGCVIVAKEQTEGRGRRGRIPKLPEFKCICEEFRAQIADPEFEGYCHCMLYYKEKG